MAETHQQVLATLARAVVGTLARRLDEALVSAALFGSVARGTAGLGSDIDLLLVLESPPHARLERFRIFWEALVEHRTALAELERRRRGVDWSPIILSRSEASERSPLYLDLVDDAVLLVDRGGFFAGVLDDMRRRLVDMEARKLSHPDGSWHWDLNPHGLSASEVIL